MADFGDNQEAPKLLLGEEKKETIEEADQKEEGNQESDSSDDEGQGVNLDFLQQMLRVSALEKKEEEEPCPPGPLEEPTLSAIVKKIQNGEIKKIIVMAGAGISVNAGIPDFRTPGTGLYDNLQSYGLDEPQSIFDIDFFKENPKPFTKLAKELYPGLFSPTLTHYFVSLLEKKGLLLRHYTQNIDNLERLAHIPSEKLVEAHGSFATAHCVSCKKEYHHEWVKGEVFADRVPRCEAKKGEEEGEEGTCQGLVKPDIIFFGEPLPRRFFDLAEEDFPQGDLLIVMGTSLAVQPFASLIDRPPHKCARLLINREVVGEKKSGGMDALLAMLMGGVGGGFRFDAPGNMRDVKFIGDVEDGVMELVRLLGWEEELEALQEKGAGSL